MPSTPVQQQAMLSVSHLYARVFARVPPEGRYTVAMSLAPDGVRVRLQVFGADGRYYEGLFAEYELDVMRGTTHGVLSWQGFFELCQKAFAEGTLDFLPAGFQLKITLKHERQNDSVPFPSFTSTILLTLSEPVNDAPVKAQTSNNIRQDAAHKYEVDEDLGVGDAALWELCDVMTSYVALRGGEKKEAERITAICKEEGVLSAEAQCLATEAEVLDRKLATMKREIQSCTAREAELLAQAKLAALPFDVNEALRAALAQPGVVDMVSTCRVADPLSGDVFSGSTSAPAAPPSSSFSVKTYDVDLLRMLKTSVCLEHGIKGAHRTCDVLQPFTEDDMKPSALKARLETDPSRAAIWEALQDLGASLAFNVFKLQEDCDTLVGGPKERRAGALFVTAYSVLYRSGAAFQLNLSEQILLQFLSALETAHFNSGFRSALRACDILQAVYCFVANLSTKKASLSNSDVVSVLLGAMSVCVTHSGFDNAFHKRTGSKISLSFGDVSAAESARVSYLLELLKLPRYDIFSTADDECRVTVQRTIAKIARMTDPEHLEVLLSTLTLRMNEERELADVEDRVLLLSVLLKAACDAYMARDSSVYEKWTVLQRAELEAQALEEQRLNVSPPTAFKGKASRSQAEIAKYFLYHLNYSAIPLFCALSEIVPLLAPLGSKLAANRARWLK